ncbi:P-loop containing nucleoside triphosphate hydrolase protein [Aspergillus insuetus]
MEHCSENRAASVKGHYQYHLRIVGNVGVGKSTLTRRIKEDTFSNDYNYDRHVVCDWLRTKVETETAIITLLHCDTAGQERFGRLHASFYQRVHCAYVVFDLTNLSSLESAADWLNDVSEYAPLAVRCLVGTKCDLQPGRIDPMGAASLAKDFGARYFEVSAASGENVNELLAAIATETLSNVKGDSGPDIKGAGFGVRTRARCY